MLVNALWAVPPARSPRSGTIVVMTFTFARSAATRAAAALVGLGLLSGCVVMGDDISTSGRIGVTADKQGQLVILLHVCEVDVNRLGIATSVPVAYLKHSKLRKWSLLHRDGRYEVRLADPGSEGWDPGTPIKLFSPSLTYEINADDNSNGALTGVVAPGELFAKLDQDTVLVGGWPDSPQKFLTRKEFDDATCADVEYYE